MRSSSTSTADFKNQPIQDVTSQYIACNGGPNPVTASPNVITVTAGSTVRAVWRHTLQSMQASSFPRTRWLIIYQALQVMWLIPAIRYLFPILTFRPLTKYRKGPVLAYLKKANNATTDGPGTGWFKISEAGYDTTSGLPFLETVNIMNADCNFNIGQVWAVTDLINAGGVQNITIPSCIAPGRYLLRAELIALHAGMISTVSQFIRKLIF